MSLVNPVHYTIFDQQIPDNKLPIVEIGSDDEAWGSITINLPITAVTMLTAAVYRLAPPTTAEYRWSRLQPELYATTPACLTFTYYQQSTNTFVIEWRFLPGVIPFAGNFQQYSIEFFVNSTPSATVTQSAPKVIVKIKNQIDFTGITGFQGVTGLSSVYQGETGIQGNLGQTGIQGITGIPGVGGGSTGIQGIQGITGVQGITGYGFQGITGASGITGITFGATGIQGVTGISGGGTGIQGVTGISGGGTGLQGVTGISGGGTGIQGVTGISGGGTGIQGVTGISGGGTGLQGVTGVQGLVGQQGVTGISGTIGTNGSTGIQGITGLYIQGLTGIQGITGLYIQGSTGIQGLTGLYIQGITGLQGSTGLLGLANFVDSTGYPAYTAPEFLWNSTSEQLFVGIAEIGHYVQVSTGSLQGSTGVQGQGSTGLQGATGLSGSGTSPSTFSFNNVSRYQVDTTSNMWVVSSSTVYQNLSWSRSGTTLTINRTDHGHSAGNMVIVRNTNTDYIAVTIDSTATDYFNVTTPNSGATSGSDGAYSLGFTYDNSVLSMYAPTGDHADVQLLSVRWTVSGATTNLTVPQSAINGAGADTSLDNCYVPVFMVRNNSASLNAVSATMGVNQSSLGYNLFNFGNMGAGTSIVLLRF